MARAFHIYTVTDVVRMKTSKVNTYIYFFRVIDDFLCTKFYKKPKPQMFCAGQLNKDSCQGDSGSAAVQSKFATPTYK